MTKGIIFDLYDTLIYTVDRKNPYMAFFNSLGLTKVEKSEWINNVLTQDYESFDEIGSIIKKSIVHTQHYQKLLEEECDNTFLFPDTISTLKRLSKKYRIFLLSNISTPYIKCYYDLGIDAYIEKPFFSCKIGFRKPNPMSFQSVIDYSGLPPRELLMIGDSFRSDYEGALNVGIKAILKNDSLEKLTIDL